MNSTEEITIYKNPNDLYQSPTLTKRTLGYSYDFPEKSQKKDKKWSIGNIFRRKKRDDSDSSSEEDSQKKGFLGRRKKKSENKRKKPVKPIGTFDHVVIPPVPRNSQIYNGYNCHEDPGILSDPTGGFSNYIGRALPLIPNTEAHQKVSRESLNDINNSRISIGSGSVDSVTRKSRRGIAKARAEARRTSSRNGSSSEEDSQRSTSSLKIRSEENLRPRDTSTSRKSRGARTERYLKRHSRDGENPHNYLRLSKSDAENSTLNWKLSDDSNRSPSRSPLVPSPVIPMNANNKLSYSSLNSQSTNMSGLSTIPPSHGSHNKYRVSNSTSNSSYRPPQSMNDYNNSTKKLLDVNMDKYFNNQRSISCDANIHKAPSGQFNEEVLHVQFPITRPNRGYRNLSLIDASQISRARQPPPPPPRDPSRLITAHYFENGRPNTFYYENSGQVKSRSFNGSTIHPNMQQTKKFSSFNLHPNYRSTSEDHIPKEPVNIHLAVRPSSTTPDTEKPQRFISRRREIKTNPDNFNYLTDKNPRSRKPIFIQPGSKTEEKPTESNSHKAIDFWKQIDRQNANPNEKPTLRKSRSNSPQMFTSHTHVQTKVFLPSVLQTDINNSNNNLLDVHRGPSPFKPVSPVPQKERARERKPDVNKEEVKRKSANLEEALDELEAIYNSLRLGDEDLLERAEQREKETQAKKLSAASIDAYPGYGSRGTLSDSSFSYEPFDTVDSPRRKRMFKKNRTVDIKYDDMAFRKIHKDRAATISDPQSVISKVSYLLASPVHCKSLGDADEETHNDGDEPDVTFDDVVYRNVKHANNSLKIVEPQPPFGIPLGPITPAANSDYLHAKPEDVYRPLYKSRKIPDIVKDDLAFRNLRKDANKGPALPPLSAEDLKNNNSSVENNRLDLNYLKKKRAQRSLSANIGNLIQDEIIERSRNNQIQSNNDVENEFKTLTDIADAMEIARKVLREKENKITATRKAFMSDTDTKYVQPISNVSSLRESRLNFLNGLKTPSIKATKVTKPTSPLLGDDILSSKPPRGLTPERKARSPKESTPIPVSPLEDKKSTISDSTSSSLEDLLNALAEEAKETTERITNELKMLGEENQKRSSLKKNDPKVEKEDEKISDLNKKLSEIDAVSEHAKMCEKLLECVVDSTDLMASTKTPEEEEVKQIVLQPAKVESANIVLSRVDSNEEKQEIEGKVESDHDYENLVSDKELNVDEVDVPTSFEDSKEPEKCRSPFEEHKAELVASFQELKQNMEDIEMPKKDETEHRDRDGTEKRKSSKIDSIYDNLGEADKDSNEKDGVTGEEECVGVLDNVALPVKECAFASESKSNTNTVNGRQIFISNCDIILIKPNNYHVVASEDIPEDSETSSGFHSNCSYSESSHYLKPDVTFDPFGSNNNLDSLESLKSPKLVLETSNKVLHDTKSNNPSESFPRSSRLVLEATESSNGGLLRGNSRVNTVDLKLSSCTLTTAPYNEHMRGPRLNLDLRRENSSQRHILNDEEKPTPTWYRDPATVAVACSYGIACAHQLASVDIFAILGILLAVISFIAAIFL